jgi:nicotinamide-nucleotide amidase
VNAEILSIGTELLLGEIADTNAAFLASELAGIGVPLYWISQVGDNPGRLRQALAQALERSDIVITTGGLGPTDDDQTREAIAAVLNESPEVDPDLERTLRKRFAAMGRDMPEKNVKQAWLIPAAEPLLNPLGTAPGWWVTTEDGRHIASMPGVPSEMSSMWSDQIRPRIEAMSRSSFKSVTLKTFGAGESAIEERLGDLVQLANPSVATYAKRDGVYVRVAASASDEAEAERLLQPVLEDVRSRLGSDAFGSANDSLASVVGALLQQRNSTVATAESITGGLVASYLTDVPGSSKHVMGGLVAYNEEIKRRFGVEADVIDTHGVVSEQAAVALAKAARKNFDADYGIGTTGAAGPEPHGSEEPGTAYIAVAADDVTRTARIRRVAPRETVKFFVALSAIDLLRRVLQEKA